ncbi:hypothetical protein [Brevundimonas sp.]|uniref:hypothetical protein n=1 Tax=Brevundimonas sp. TaxID=1871086 RepID=UPI0035B4C592
MSPASPPAYRLVRVRDGGAPVGDGLRRWLGKVSPLHGLGAALAFRDRFDRAVQRQALSGRGASMSPGQARLVFGEALDLRIDPARLTHRLADAWDDDGDVRSADQAFIDGGDWREIIYPVSDSRSHVEMLDLCRWRADFRRTSRYRVLAEQIAAGQAPRRDGVSLKSISDLDRHYLRGLALIESLERQGLQAVSRASSERRPPPALRRAPWREWAERDIGVAVATDGSLVRHTCGRHRFAAAQGLGLASIPVEVRLVHAGWLAEAASRLGLPPHRALPIALSEVEARHRR